MKVLIRQEVQGDYAQVHKLIAEAFASAEHSDGNEQDLVKSLRKGSAFIPELSLVAEINGELAGHILFTKAAVGQEEVLVLAPLSVRPGYQRQGIGTALVRRGHEIAVELGYRYSMVLGSELYYPRFGYVPAESMGVNTPEDIPPCNFMAARLLENAEPIRGELIYAKEFAI